MRLSDCSTIRRIASDLEGLHDLRSANPLLSPSSALGRAAQHPTTIPEPIEISNVIEINVPTDDNQEIANRSKQSRRGQ
jgi:hypothetical protein